jgi:hypothetical protein
MSLIAIRADVAAALAGFGFADLADPRSKTSA